MVFMSVYTLDEEKSDRVFLSKSLDETSELTKEEIEPKQHFTQPPAHFTEASLVKHWRNLASDVRVLMLRLLQRFLAEDIL